MTVDISKIKPGDEVTVRFTIGADWVPHSWSGGYLDSAGDDHELNVSDILSHTPKALSVGDRVRYASRHITPEAGELVAIHEGEGWVKWRRTGAHAVAPLSDLERAP